MSGTLPLGIHHMAFSFALYNCLFEKACLIGGWGQSLIWQNMYLSLEYRVNINVSVCLENANTNDSSTQKPSRMGREEAWSMWPWGDADQVLKGHKEPREMFVEMKTWQVTCIASGWRNCMMWRERRAWMNQRQLSYFIFILSKSLFNVTRPPVPVLTAGTVGRAQEGWSLFLVLAEQRERQILSK